MLIFLISYSMRVEHPPYSGIIDSVDSLKNLESFFGEFFSSTEDQSAYVRNVISDLERSPHRGANPDYLRLFARIALMCAEYGFPETKAHKKRHETQADFLGLERDYLHPMYLLELGRYLASINVKSFEHKLKTINYWNYRLTRGGYSPESRKLLEHQIWGHFVMPQSGAFQMPEAEELEVQPGRENMIGRHTGVHSDRLKIPLPLVIPEHGFHLQLSQLKLSVFDVDTVGPRIFRARLLEPAQMAFGSYTRVENAVLRTDQSGQPLFC